MSYQPEHSLQQTFETLYHILFGLGLLATFNEIYTITQIDKKTNIHFYTTSPTQ